MNDTQLETIEQLRAFLAGTEAIEFSMESPLERYTWIQDTLIRLRYVSLSKGDKGVVRRYLQKVTGYSRQQLTRLIGQYKRTGKLGRRYQPRHRFATHYSAQDIVRLAQTDELHGTLSGPATKKIFEREYTLFGNPTYERLAGISVSHLYNLRKCTGYCRQRCHFTKTQATPVKIAERRKPDPGGQPGYLRLDTVHQGDLDGRKGVYHINAVDEVTQYEIVASVERISEAYLLPVLEMLLEAFPFVIQGFHADNGSEYINKRVAELLNKLLIEFTKSRSRHTNDNALVESKNGAVVRKHLGYAHIPQKYASLINDFNRGFLNPYLNFHRPCFFAQITVDAKGKQRKRYPYKQMMTPYEKLKSLPNAPTYLKADITFAQLDAVAMQMSDNEAARQLNRARQQLFKHINEQEAA